MPAITPTDNDYKNKIVLERIVDYLDKRFGDEPPNIRECTLQEFQMWIGRWIKIVDDCESNNIVREKKATRKRRREKVKKYLSNNL